MKNTKIVFGVYSAWAYHKEIEDLNKMSEKGWQLTKAGVFINRYTRNENIRYIYQLDYNPKIEDYGRYIETFREQGWEYINSTFNGWHYFRKLYDPSLPVEDYEIYCDNESLKEMHDRWRKLANRLVVIVGIAFILELICVIRAFNIPQTILCITLLLEFIMILRGSIRLKNTEASRKGGQKMTAIFVVLFLGVLLSFITMFL